MHNTSFGLVGGPASNDSVNAILHHQPTTTEPETVEQNINSDEQMLPPEHLFSDYIEIAYLGAVILAGLAFNCCVLKRLLREKRQAERGARPENAFLLLKLNLNVSDLLILLIHALGKLAWLITYEWRGGDTLCRVFNFLSMFTLYLSSNIVICIALDRLLTVLSAQKIHRGQRKLNLVRLMLGLAWSLSLVFSLPQLFVWTTYNPFRSSNSQGWVQCTDIWSIDKYERFLAEQSGLKATSTMATQTSSATGVDGDWWTRFVLSTVVQNAYELTHLFLVFYGPLIVLVSCYALISTRLIRFAKNNPRCSSQQATSLENGHSGHQPGENQQQKSQHHHNKNCKRALIKSFPAVRLYAPLERLRRKSHHPSVPMIDIHEVSTRAEETSAEQATSQYMTSGSGSTTEERTALMETAKKANKLALQQDRKEELVDADFLPGGRAAILMRSSRCGSVPNGGGGMRSCSSCSSLCTATAFVTSSNNEASEAVVGKPRQLFVRIRNSFRNSIGRRLGHHPLRGQRLGVNLALHSSSVASLSIADGTSADHKAMATAGQKATAGKSCCWWWWWPIWQRKALREHIWQQQQQNQNSGDRCLSTGGHQHQQNGHRHDFGRRQSTRSSLSTTATLATLSARPSQHHQQAQQPLWRRHLRSRAFRATLLVILAHVLLWSPYNVYALMKHVNEQAYERMSEQANVLKDLQFLIVLINPFLYGFGRRVQGKEQPQRTGAL